MIKLLDLNLISFNKKDLFIKLFWSFVLIIIVWIHFFFSVFPHSFNNLKKASYSSYKTWQITEAEGIFLYHPEYLPMLFEMNIKKEKRRDFILDHIETENIRAIIKNNKIEEDIRSVTSILSQMVKSSSIDTTIRKAAKKSLLSIYENISNPDKKYKSDVIIYRLWTFLTYFITENNKRLLNDNLINKFDKYIYDSWSVDKTVDNMKNIWLSYVLADLNAATIDKDPRRDLTRRYENLLKTFVSDRLELIETDSICLKIALEEYKKSSKTKNELDSYMVLAWVNHESYLSWWVVINRNQKGSACFKYINQLIKDDKIDSSNYSYLLWFKQFLEKNKITGDKQVYAYMTKYFNHWFKALFRIK